MADLVLWRPALFGAKPEMIIKGGFVSYAKMGDANASIPTPQPVIYRPMFGAFGGAVASTCATFVSQASLDLGIVQSYGLKKMLLPVKGCRKIGKADMIHNDATPKIGVNPENYRVTVDGEHITCEPAVELPLAQRYFMF